MKQFTRLRISNEIIESGYTHQQFFFHISVVSFSFLSVVVYTCIISTYREKYSVIEYGDLRCDNPFVQNRCLRIVTGIEEQEDKKLCLDN